MTVDDILNSENLKYLEPVMLVAAVAGHVWIRSIFSQNIKISGGPLYRLFLAALLFPVVWYTVNWFVDEHIKNGSSWTEMNELLISYCLIIFVCVVAVAIGLLSNKIFKKDD
jgi:hypothetical protein